MGSALLGAAVGILVSEKLARRREEREQRRRAARIALSLSLRLGRLNSWAEKLPAIPTDVIDPRKILNASSFADTFSESAIISAVVDLPPGVRERTLLACQGGMAFLKVMSAVEDRVRVLTPWTIEDGEVRWSNHLANDSEFFNGYNEMIRLRKEFAKSVPEVVGELNEIGKLAWA